MSEPTSTSALDAGIDPDVQPKKASWWEDYIDIFYTPSTVFLRRMTSGFGLPMLILTLVIGGLVIVNSGAISSIADAEFTRSTAAAMKANPQLTPEMMQKGRGFAEGLSKVGGFIFVPVGVLFVGLFLWIVGKFVGAKQTLGAAMMVTAYSFVPRALEQVLVSIQALVLDTSAMRGAPPALVGSGAFPRSRYHVAGTSWVAGTRGRVHHLGHGAARNRPVGHRQYLARQGGHSRRDHVVHRSGRNRAAGAQAVRDSAGGFCRPPGRRGSAKKSTATSAAEYRRPISDLDLG